MALAGSGSATGPARHRGLPSREYYDRERSLYRWVALMTPQEKLRRFEEQISPHLKSAYNLAKWLTRSHEDAEDVVQDTYLRAFSAFESLGFSRSTTNSSGRWKQRAATPRIEGESHLVAQSEIRGGPRSGSGYFSLRANKDLVLVPVSVIDQRDHPVIGLEQKNFRIFDGRKEQRVESLSMVDEPLAVGLVFDTSRSIGPKLRSSRVAAKAFLDSANPEDEFLLVEFNDRPTLSVPLTNDPSLIQTRLAATESKGRTALLDAIYLGLSEIKKSKKSRKALLVISDGGDNHSRHR